MLATLSGQSLRYGTQQIPEPEMIHKSPFPDVDCEMN